MRRALDLLHTGIAKVAVAVAFIGGVVSGTIYLVHGFTSATSEFEQLQEQHAAPDRRGRVLHFASLAPPEQLPGGLQLIVAIQRKGESAKWRKEARIVPGDVVQWRLQATEAGTSDLDHVSTRVVLAPHLRLVAGSVRIINANGDRQQPDAPLFAGGFDIGNFVPQSTEYVIFDTRSLGDFAGCARRVRVYALIHADESPEVDKAMPSNSADAVIGKGRC